MFYLAADDHLLESYALQTFDELARIGSTDRVHLVALLDRVGGTSIHPKWSDTRRFYIRKGGVLVVDAGTPQEDCPNQECDMGDPDTLARFIAWAQSEESGHRAKHYALILWGHGTGFTLNPVGNTLLDDSLRRTYLDSFRERYGEWRERKNLHCLLFGLAAPPKEILTDVSSGRSLRNKAVQRVLAASPNHSVDVLGLDACLMGMIETAYAMKDVATVMTASEQDIPGTSMDYGWVRELVEDPDLQPAEIGSAMVRGYCRKYRGCDRSEGRNRTLSAVNLKDVNEVAGRLDGLSCVLRAAIRDEEARLKVAKARGDCLIYGDFAESGRSAAFHNIDLLHFCERLIAANVSADVTAAAKPVIEAVRHAVIASYADRDEKCHDYGSSGIGIYFPRTKDQFDSDVYAAAYNSTGSDPDTPDFVREREWPKFLKEYSAFRDTNVIVESSPPCMALPECGVKSR